MRGMVSQHEGIMVTTCSKVNADPVMSTYTPETVIIDEAAALTEADTVIPISQATRNAT